MFRFKLPKEAIVSDGPDETPVQWLMTYGNYDGNIDFVHSKVIGSGAYGSAHLTPDTNMIVKYMKMRQDSRVVREPGETYVDAFIRDVLREIKMQEKVYENIMGVDGKPITPKVYGAGVFQLPNGNVVGIIVMDKEEDIVKMAELYRTRDYTDKSKGYEPYDMIFDDVPEIYQDVRDVRAFVQSIYDQFEAYYQKAHALDVYHNDLQNTNIFVKVKDGKPILKILDFGLARTKSDTIKLLKQRGFNTQEIEIYDDEFQGRRQLDRYKKASIR